MFWNINIGLFIGSNATISKFPTSGWKQMKIGFKLFFVFVLDISNLNIG
jgi:hypothetical protein